MTSDLKRNTAESILYNVQKILAHKTVIKVARTGDLQGPLLVGL